MTNSLFYSQEPGWVIFGPLGVIPATFEKTRDYAYFSAFDFMPEDFRSKWWKNHEGAMKAKAYQKAGYKAKRVMRVEQYVTR